MMLVLSTLMLIPLNTWKYITWALSVSTVLMTWMFYMSSHSIFLMSLYWNQMLYLVDTLSWALLVLTLYVGVFMLLSNPIIIKNKIFLSIIVPLIIVLMNCFMVHKMVLFYIMFEFTIIPTATLIMLFGYQPERLQASLYIIMYTMVASLPLLLSILYIKPNLNFIVLNWNFLNPTNLVPWSLMFAFLVKTPIYLVHMWLPKAHVEAPVSGSILLAGLLLKLGSYAVIRMMIMNLQFNSILCLISVVALWGSCLAAMNCTRQTDMKCLIANSSVAHMGIGMVGILVNLPHGWVGASLMLISHGLTSPLMFFLSSVYYTSTKTRSLPITSGMQLTTPEMMLWWCLAMVSNSSIPPTINMVGELQLIMCTYSFFSFWIPQIILLSVISLLYSTLLFIIMHHGGVNKIKMIILPSTTKILSLLLALPVFMMAPMHQSFTYYMY